MTARLRSAFGPGFFFPFSATWPRQLAVARLAVGGVPPSPSKNRPGASAGFSSLSVCVDLMAVSLTLPAADDYGAGTAPAYMRRPGQDVLDAAYHTAHGYPGGIAALALRMGVSANTLTHKVNPANTTHHLTLREAQAMQTLSGNLAILHAMADALGHVCTPATPDRDGGEPVDTVMRLQMAHADFLHALADAVRAGDARVTPNQARRADHHAQELIACIGHAMAMLRGLMRQAPRADE